MRVESASVDLVGKLGPLGLLAWFNASLVALAAGAPLPPLPGGAPAARRHLLLVNNLGEAVGGEGKHITTGAPTLPEMVRALDQADGWWGPGTPQHGTWYAPAPPTGRGSTSSMARGKDEHQWPHDRASELPNDTTPLKTSMPPLLAECATSLPHTYPDFPTHQKTHTLIRMWDRFHF